MTYYRYSIHLFGGKVIDPFALKFYFAIQNNIGANFGDGLNSVTCEFSLTATTTL